MRILGLEITRVPKSRRAVWTRASVAPLGLLITSMTPEELRHELCWVAEQLNKGNYLYVGGNDIFHRVLSSRRPLPYHTED